MSNRRKRLDPWYVTGLAQGDAAFTYSRSGHHLALYFAMKLTDTDRDLLVKLQDFFHGAGRIYRVIRRLPRSGSGYAKLAAYYRICRRDELERVVSHFDRYPLRGAKAASYAIWRRMVVLKRTFRRPNRTVLDVLAARLSSTSPRNMPWTAGIEGSLESTAAGGDFRGEAIVFETPQSVSAAKTAPEPSAPAEISPPTSTQGSEERSSKQEEPRRE